MTATQSSLIVRHATLRELYDYSDCANTQLLDTAANLSAAQLDRRFDMGFGTLRDTLNHILMAERVWLDRWLNTAGGKFRTAAEDASITQLRTAFSETAAARDAFLRALPETDFAQDLSYRNLKGQAATYPLGITVLHVANHGQYHRAQALNMLRHVGATLPKPGADYIFVKLAQPGGGTNAFVPPTLDLDSLRTYFVYDDWAQRQVLDRAAELSDAQLDRQFDMGCGTLRETIAHIRFAEQWWLENWTLGPENPFPETPPNTSVAELRRLFDETAAGRNAYISKLSSNDLFRFIKAQPRPGMYREFPLGVIMLQMCLHGTHHRAQAVNMIRRVGGNVPGLDLVRMLNS